MSERDTTYGTFEVVITEIRRLNDIYQIRNIVVYYDRPAKPVLSLVKKEGIAP